MRTAQTNAAAEGGRGKLPPEPIPATEAPQRTPGADVIRAPHSTFPIPELLAPAGDWDCARAAVENGADAIYFGLEKFNALIPSLRPSPS